MPAVDLIRPAVQDVLEAPERSPALDGDPQTVGPVGVADRANEPLHIAIGVAGSLAVNVEPAIGILVFWVLVASLLFVFNGCLVPDLAGLEVDAPAARQDVALEDDGQLVERYGSGRSIGVGPSPIAEAR